MLQYFKRDADELESWINEKLQAASDESYKDPTNLQVFEISVTHYRSLPYSNFIILNSSNIEVFHFLLVILQAKIQKHQAFEAEVAAHSNAIVMLDNTGMEMINQSHYASEEIRQRLGIYKNRINFLFISVNVGFWVKLITLNDR